MTRDEINAVIRFHADAHQVPSSHLREKGCRSLPGRRARQGAVRELRDRGVPEEKIARAFRMGLKSLRFLIERMEAKAMMGVQEPVE